MLTKIKVEKTYWVGMTEQQKLDIISVLQNISEKDYCGDTFSDAHLESLSDLRQALLNV